MTGESSVARSDSASIIVRRRLDARLARALAFPVAVAGGSAGSGKSIALGSYLERHAIAHVRYGVDPHVTTLASFVRGLAAALAPIAPGAFLSSSIVYERARGSATAALDIAAWLREHTRGITTTIFIDGLGGLEGDREIAELIAACIDETQGRLRWVLAARDLSAFPIASWLAHRSTDIPLDENDLRLSVDDAVAIATVRGRTLGATAVAALVERLDGWPLGVSFGIDTVGELAGVLATPPEREQTLRYFAALALASLSDGDAALLLEASLLPDLAPDVLGRLPLEEAAETIDRLRHAAPTIFAGAASLQFEPTFHRALVERRDRKGAAWLSAAAQLAAQALEDADRPAEALALLNAHAGAESVGRLLEHYGLALIDDGRSDVVASSIERLQGTEFTDHPIVLAIRALLESQLGRFDTAEAWFRLAIHTCTDPDIRLQIAYRFALDAMRRNRPDSVESLASVLPEETAHTPAPTELAMRATLATAHAASGNAEKAHEAIEAVLTAVDGSVPGAIAARIFHQAAFVALRRESFDRARALAERAIDVAKEAGAYDVVARANTVLYQIAIDVDDDPADAVRYLEEFARYGLMAGNGSMRMFALLATFDIEIERADDEALATLERALEGPELVQHSQAINEALLPGEAMRAAWDGDFEHAYRLIANCADGETAPARRAQRHAEAAVYAAVAGHADEARTALELGREEARDIAADTREGRTPALLALAALVAGERAAARLLLEDARSRGAGRNRRTASFVAAVSALERYASGAASFADVGTALRALDNHELRGYRLLIEAIPARFFTP